MDAKEILEAIWTLLNSPVGITAVAGVVLWLLNRIYSKKPLWKRFEGAIITGIKFAEKNISDQTPNKSLKRLDEALKYVLRVYAEVEKKAATAAEVSELREGIQITHAELEAKGTL